jgi:hypothetical protein
MNSLRDLLFPIPDPESFHPDSFCLGNFHFESFRLDSFHLDNFLLCLCQYINHLLV